MHLPGPPAGKMIVLGISQAAMWAGIAGLAAGFILGLLGAGGTVVGLPFFLYLAVISPHTSLGSNALGVSMIALLLYAYRLWKRQTLVGPGLVYTIPGLGGILVGAELGVQYPGAGLVFLLGFVLIAISGWLFYLGRRVVGPNSDPPAPGPPGRLSAGRILKIAPAALAVGGAAGFFGIGGGFMIVPSLSLAAGIELTQAISTALLPIAAFAGLVGATYLRAGDANVLYSLVMVRAGALGGYLGIRLGMRIEKRAMYTIFAAFLALMGAYMVLQG